MQHLNAILTGNTFTSILAKSSSVLVRKENVTGDLHRHSKRIFVSPYCSEVEIKFFLNKLHYLDKWVTVEEPRSLEIQDWRRAAPHWGSFSAWSHFHLHSLHSRGILVFRHCVCACVCVERERAGSVSELLSIYGARTRKEISLIFLVIFFYLMFLQTSIEVIFLLYSLE